MPTLQSSDFCPNCQQQRLFTAQGMNHTPHILASVFLCGTWLPIWILLALTYKPRYRCGQCGFSNTGSSNAGYNNGKKIIIGAGAFILLFIILSALLFSSGTRLSKQATNSQPVEQKTPLQMPNSEILTQVKTHLESKKGYLGDNDYYFIDEQLNKIPQGAAEYQEAQKILTQYKTQIDSAKQKFKSKDRK